MEGKYVKVVITFANTVRLPTTRSTITWLIACNTAWGKADTNAFRLRQNGCHFADDIFIFIFLYKLLYFDSNFTQIRDYLHKGPVMHSFDVFCIASLNDLLNKQLSCWWFEKAWCAYNVTIMHYNISQCNCNAIELQCNCNQHRNDKVRRYTSGPFY